MKILVTGGAGYIGSVLTPMLLQEGHQVTVIDNMLYGGQTLTLCTGHPEFDCYRVDCRDPDAVRPHLKSADVVIPLAALVGAPLCDLNPVDAELLNLRAPLTLFTMLSHDQMVIMPTTESVYGKNATLCTEDTPTNPLSTYGKHKVTVEQALLARGNAISLRLATVFGMSPRMRIDLLVNDFVWRAHKDRAFVVFEAKARRTVVHVRDVAAAMIHALSLDQAQGVYNVGSVTLSKLSLCEAIKEQIPGFHYVEAQYATDPDARDYVVSDAKIRATGFESRWTLEAGITELLKGYRLMRNTVHGNV